MAKKTYREGKKATLFPTVKSGEDRATSIFLAVLKEVQPLRKVLLSSIGIKVRKRKSTFDARVHPEFSTRNISKDIPDGIITLEQDKLWAALIEVKIEKSDLNQDQLERYLKRVKEFDCQALITISNEMCTAPTLPPLRLATSDKSLKRIAHYHWSWKFIQSQVSALLHADLFENVHEKFILREFLLFLRDPHSGVLGFTRMNRNWADFVQRIEVRGNPSQDEFEEVVSDWHQESAELCLIMQETLQTSVSEVLQFDGKRASENRLNHDVKHLKKTSDLESTFSIEGQKYDLIVSVDINRRLYSIEMRHDLPDTVKSPQKRIEHFLKKFGPDGQHDGMSIFAKWPYLPDPTDTTLFKAIQATYEKDWDDTDLIHPDKDAIMYVTLTLTRTPGKSVFRSNTKLIANLEADVKFFLEHYVNL